MAKRKSAYELRMEVDHKTANSKKANTSSASTSSNARNTNTSNSANASATKRKSAYELRMEVDNKSANSKDRNYSTERVYDFQKQRALKENSYNKYRYEPDYQKYSALGNSMKNPSYNQADGSASIFGWQPFAKDVKNKVTYSRDNAALLAMDDNNGEGNPKYKFMTDDEVGIYNYLLAKDGEQMADKYLESIDRVLNERSTKGYADTTKKMSSDNKVVGTALNLGSSFLTPAAYAATIGQTIKNKVTGSKDVVDTNSGAFGPVAIEQASREGLKKDTGAVGDFLIDTGLSMGQFATKLPLGSVGSLALMGTGAAGQTAKDIVERGGNQDQVMLGSTAAGAAEVVFERISLEQLKAFKNMPATSVSALVKNILKSTFTEGSEEVATDISNAITDKLIMGDSSQMDVSYRNYKAKGMTDSQAKKQVAIDFAKQLGLDFAGGAISGGVLGAGANIYGGYTNYRNGKVLSDVQQEVIDEGLQSQPTTDSYQSATQLQQQLNNGKKINNMALGQQYINNIQAINEEEQQARQQAELQQNVQAEQQPLQQQELQQNVPQNLLQSERVQQTNPLVTNTNRETTPLVQNQVQNNVLANNTQRNTQNNIQSNVQNNVQGSNLATEQIKRTNPSNSTIATSNPQFGANTNVREPITKATATFANNNTPITVKGINSVSNGNVILSVDNGDSKTVANLDDVTFANERTAKVYSLASNYTSDGAKAFVTGYNGSLDLSTYVKAFNQYYNGGKTNLPIATINNLSVFSKFIPDAIKQQAYFAGQNYANTEIEQKQQNVKAKNTQSGIQNADALNKISEEETMLIHYISKVANVSVVVDDDIEGANGYYKDGEIHISANADNKPLVIYSHELTHYMEDTSPKLWKNYKDYVINYMKSEHFEEYNKLTEHIKDLYRLNNMDITDDAIMNEIAANATEEFLTDAKAIETLVKENRTLAEKILDVLTRFVEVIKSKFSDYTPTSTEGKMLRSNAEVLNKARKLWLKALNDSANVGTVSNEKVASLKETKFSIKDSGLEFQQWNDNVRVFDGLNWAEYTNDGKLVNEPKIEKYLLSNEKKEIAINKIKSFKKPPFKEKVYLRFNEIPKGGKSKNWVTNKFENGLSVYELKYSPLKGNYEITGETLEGALIKYIFERANVYFVTGEEVSRGSDREPILKNAKIVGMAEYNKDSEGWEVKADDKVASLKETDAKTELSDTLTRYSIREEEPPKKTIIGYKVFYAKDGKLYPPMVANTGGVDTPIGVWLNADVGTIADEKTKTGRTQVLAGGKGTARGKQTLAFRPGWHLGEVPKATQFLKRSTGEFPKDFVWAECEIAADVDYQEEAMSYGITPSGKFQHSLAGLPKLPANGYYKYRTNPNPDTVPWLITGAMKVNKILNDDEVNEILKAHGEEPVPREGGNIDLEKLGLSQYADVRFSLKDSEEIAKKAEKEFGVTINFKEAGYLTVNGKLLDFSGKKQGGQPGYRSMDHREISDILDLPEDAEYSDGLIEFMKQGNVRLHEYGIDISVMPNAKQLTILKKFFDRLGGEVTVDFSKLNGNNAGSIDYPEGTKNSKIIADMETFFSTGEVPELSDFNKFRFSLKDSEGNTLTKEQQEFFKDSKVRDDKGNLLKLYHGSNSKERINIFKTKNFAGYSGLYLSDNEKVARSMTRLPNDDGMYEVYANILNPFIVDADYKTYDGILKPNEMINVKSKTVDTQQIAAFARYNGYDGVIVKNIKEWAGYGTDIIAFEPEQIKSIDNTNPTSNTDIRFSMKYTTDVDIEKLTEENTKLKEANELLQSQFKLTKGYVPNEKALSKVANSILKDYSSTYDRNTLVDNLKSLYEYISKSETMSWDEVMEATVGMAKSIVESSSKLNDDLYNQYADLRQELRTTNITLSDEVKNELAYYYDSYENFRKQNFGRINLKNNGIKLDELWSELSTKYSELFDVDTNALEQPMKLVEVLDMIKPYYENLYGMNMDAVAYDLALELYNQYFMVPGVETFADKKANELRNVRNKYLNYIDSMREDYKTRYDARLKKVKQQQIEQIQKISEKFKTANEEDKARYKQMYNNLMDRKNDQLLNQRARFQEQRLRSNRTRKERAEIKKYRTRIEKNVKDLTTWITHPTDAKHVPEVFKKTVLEFLSSLDMTSTRLNAKGELTKKTLAWQDTADNLRRMLQEMETVKDNNDTGGTINDFYMDIDPELVERLDNFVGGNRQYDSIHSMGEEQLREIDYLVSVVKKAVTEANKMKANLRYQSIVDLGNKSMEELSNMRYRKAHNDIINKLDKFINLEQMDSFSYFESLGETATTIQQELRNGHDKHTLNINQTIEYMNLLKGKTNTNKWTGKDAAIKTFDINGKEVKMTVAQIMELYELSKREQALGHIYGGGIKIQEVVGKEDNKTQRLRHIKPITLTEETLHTIIDSLTDEQKRIADSMQEFMSNQASTWGNETSLEMYGYKKFTEPNYYPIKSDDNYTLTKDQDSATGQLYAIKNLGMTKATVKHANNPLIVGDIFDTFTRHINEMSTYNAFLIPLSDAMKWYNYKQRVETEKNGKVVKVVNGTIKESIERVWNNPGKSYFVELIKAINGVSNASSSSEIFDNMIANVKIASVGASLSTVIQQPTAYLRASYMVDMKYLVMGLAKKPQIAKAKTYSPIVLWKSWGFFDINIGRSMKSIITGERTMIEDIKEKSLWLATQADNVTLGTLWNAIEFETKAKHKELKYGTEEFNKAVGERLSEVIDRTQVVDTILHRSKMMRDKNSLVKMATSFMSEPNKSYNMMRNAFINAIDNKSVESTKNLARAIFAVVSSGILAGAAKALVDAFRDKDKEKEYVDKYYEYFKSDAWDNLNPLNFLPITREFVSLSKGFSPQRMDMTAFTNMYYAVNEVIKFSQGESKKSNYAIFSQVSRAMSQLFGIPFGNALREVESIYNNVSADGIDMESDTATAKKTYLTMYQALMQGDNAKYDKLLSYLNKHDKKESAIESGLQNALVDNEPLITEAGQARLSGNIARYKAIVNELKGKGFKQDVVVKAINSYLTSLKPKTEKSPSPVKIFKYDDLFTAIDKNNTTTMEEIRDYLVENGTDLKSIQSQITKRYKDTYVGYYNNGDTDGMARMEDTLISYFGYDEDTLSEWKGITTTNMAQSLIDGDTDKVDEILSYKLDGLEGEEYDKKLNSFKSTITKKVKPTYLEYYENGDTDSMKELKSLLMNYFNYQEETIDKWLEVEE